MAAPQEKTNEKEDEEKTPEPEPKKEQPEVLTVTHADLKAMCLKVARAGKKNEVKAVLKGYGAIKAVDVSVNKIVEVISKLEEL